MFFTTIEKECITLKFKNQAFDLECCPETMDVLYTTQRFDTKPANGTFYFTWNEEHITFEVAKYGNGQGGSLKIVIPSTPELINSLINSLQDIQLFTQSHQN
jgi:hypothetical protein